MHRAISKFVTVVTDSCGNLTIIHPTMIKRNPVLLNTDDTALLSDSGVIEYNTEGMCR